MADTTEPTLIMLRPKHEESGVRLDSNILLEVWDMGTGVDASTVVINVNEVVAWTGDAQQTGFAVTKTVLANRIRYEINPDSNFKPTEFVRVDVTADDLEASPNSMSEQRVFCTGAWL